jgi:hypothetical protein
MILAVTFPSRNVTSLPHSDLCDVVVLSLISFSNNSGQLRIGCDCYCLWLWREGLV